jgi:hypothetical protein
MFKSPLTDYDTWACLAPGFLLLAAFDRATGLGWIWRETWTTSAGIFAVAAAYIVGQTISSLASAIMERGLVHRLLLPPSRVLLSEGVGPWWARKIFQGYYRPLAAPAPQRVNQRAREAGIDGDGDAIFQWAYSAARENKGVSDKLATFLNQYSMARNVALATVICAVILSWSAFTKPMQEDWWWVGAAALSSIILGYRYLKFYRLYAAEIFRFVAFQEPKNAR